MARGPFQGTFQPNLRPTITTAPDAIVYINGETEMIGCVSCKRKVPFNRYITSIQVDLNVDSAPGSASITMSVPRHSIDDVYFDGKPILTPMMEVEIFAKGYYVLEGIPQYYPIFWGVVTEVGDGYSSGEHTLTLQCADILKWWELCRMNINPAYLAPTPGMGRSIFGNVLFGKNPYDVIFTLAQQSFGDVVIGTGSLTSIVVEKNQPNTFKTALQDAMLYWEERFSKIRSNLLLYGVNGVAVRGASIDEAYRSKGLVKAPVASTAVLNANGALGGTQAVYDPTDPNVTAFRTQFMQAGEINFWQSEYETKLNIANTCKTAIGFEFYMDVTGDIVFKPPFYNLDVLENKPVSWIQDIDVISWDFSESEAEVITQLQIDGNWGGNVDYGMPEELTPHVTVTDYHLLRRYGWRVETLNSEFLSNPQQMFYYGLDMLDRMNARRHRGSVTIPCRPELRLGFPVYVAPRDEYWYVSGISHSIEFGGRAQTTLTLTAKRGKFSAPQGIAQVNVAKKSPNAKGTGPKELAKHTWMVKMGDAASFPQMDDTSKPNQDSAYSPLILRHPKTGRVCGHPNVVMVYTRPFKATPDRIEKTAGRKPDGQTGAVAKANLANFKVKAKAQAKADAEGFSEDELSALKAKYSQNRFLYGLTSAGVYVYAHDQSKLLDQFALIPSGNIQVTPKAPGKFGGNFNGMIRPVSDARGFEVIGHYRYGRGVSLRDGSLVLKQGGGANERVKVGTQLALSGDLFASLTAQSQGLTTLVSAYSNPAACIADIKPEDLQTAAVQEPDREPEFVNPDTSFVSTAPLGSPEREGMPPSVEASQLSRALTIAEMGVLEEQTPNENCVCLSGRADLAFINIGYQVQTLYGSVPDVASLFDQQQLNTTGGAADTAAIPTKPSKPASLTYAEVASKIDNFLFNLYTRLDQDHMVYEEGLRGNLTPGRSEPNPADALPGQTTPQADLAPPFSKPMRAAEGDPRATAAQASSAIDDLQKAYSDFGKDTRSAANKAAAGQEIRNLQAEAAKLQKKRDELVHDMESGTSVNFGFTSTSEYQEAIAKVDAQLAALRQQIADKQAQYNQMG